MSCLPRSWIAQDHFGVHIRSPSSIKYKKAMWKKAKALQCTYLSFNDFVQINLRKRRYKMFNIQIDCFCRWLLFLRNFRFFLFLWSVLFFPFICSCFCVVFSHRFFLTSVVTIRRSIIWCLLIKQIYCEHTRWRVFRNQWGCSAYCRMSIFWLSSAYIAFIYLFVAKTAVHIQRQDKLNNRLFL